MNKPDLEMQTIMRAKVLADVYAGPKCDEIGEHSFWVYCDGATDSSTDHQDITLKASQLPPGARIRVEYPCCPECGMIRQEIRECKDGKYYFVGFESKCICDFDWEEWVKNEFS